ncbi:MAG: guanylate kinase [Nitrospirae bacterium]|nr:guanylate kinase [Nitrospirota bacterium]
MGILYVVSAPSGAGKTSLCKELVRIDPTLSHSISHTTRKPRAGEVHGEHYYFVTQDEFREMAAAGGFVEWAEVHGNSYGTSKAELQRLFGLGRDVIVDIDTQGAMQVKKYWPGAVLIFILPPSMEELERRLRGRETDDDETIRKRVGNAKGEIRYLKEYRYVVVNDDFSEALGELGAVVAAERAAVERLDKTWLMDNFGI